MTEDTNALIIPPINLSGDLQPDSYVGYTLYIDYASGEPVVFQSGEFRFSDLPNFTSGVQAWLLGRGVNAETPLAIYYKPEVGGSYECVYDYLGADAIAYDLGMSEVTPATDGLNGYIKIIDDNGEYQSPVYFASSEGFLLGNLTTWVAENIGELSSDPSVTVYSRPDIESEFEPFFGINSEEWSPPQAMLEPLSEIKGAHSPSPPRALRDYPGAGLELTQNFITKRSFRARCRALRLPKGAPLRPKGEKGEARRARKDAKAARRYSNGVQPKVPRGTPFARQRRKAMAA